jgi:hypothetical protein
LNLGLKAGLDVQKMVEVWGAGVGGPRLLETVSLKPWNTSEEIIEVIRGRTGRPPAIMDSDGQTPLEDFGTMYKRLAMEMAKAVGAEMPISELIDKIRDTESIYDGYSALIK